MLHIYFIFSFWSYDMSYLVTTRPDPDPEMHNLENKTEKVLDVTQIFRNIKRPWPSLDNNNNKLYI